MIWVSGSRDEQCTASRCYDLFVAEMGVIEAMTSNANLEDVEMCGKWEEENEKGVSVALLPSFDYLQYDRVNSSTTCAV